MISRQVAIAALPVAAAAVCLVRFVRLIDQMYHVVPMPPGPQLAHVPVSLGALGLVAAGAVMFALAVTAAAPRHRLGWLAMSGSAAFVGADARMRWHDAWPHGDFLVHVVMLGTFAVGSVLVASDLRHWLIRVMAACAGLLLIGSELLDRHQHHVISAAGGGPLTRQLRLENFFEEATFAIAAWCLLAATVAVGERRWATRPRHTS